MVQPLLRAVSLEERGGKGDRKLKTDDQRRDIRHLRDKTECPGRYLGARGLPANQTDDFSVMRTVPRDEFVAYHSNSRLQFFFSAYI